MTAYDATAIKRHPEARPRAAGRALWRPGLPLAVGVIGLAHAPWLLEQGRTLWGLAHYRFVVAVPIGAVLLAVRGVRGLGTLNPGGRWAALAALAASGLLIALAGLFYSPLLGTVAAVAACAALAYGLGGDVLLRAVLPACAFLAVAVRPPLRIDVSLIGALQGLATRWSSRLLDLLGVYHIAEGHVLELPGRRLFVEQACSGIQSLFVVLGGTLFYLLWTRRGWASSIALLAAAAAWVVLGNVARITAVAFLLARAGVDLSGGVPHEVLGAAILLLMLGLVVSTDRLIGLTPGAARRFATPLARWWAHRSREAAIHRLALRGRSWEEIVSALDGYEPGPDLGAGLRPGEVTTAPGPGPASGAGRTVWPDPRRTVVTSWTVVTAFALIGLAQAAVVRNGFWFAAPALDRAFAGLKADDLPGRWGGWRRVAFDAESLGPPGAFGRHSRRWTYRPDRGDAAALTVEVDHPFVGWHEVTDCYESLGWEVKRRDLAGGCAVVRMARPLDGHGLLVFTFDGGAGEAVAAPPGQGWGAVLRERLAVGGWRLRGSPGAGGRGAPGYQVQLLLQSEDPATPVDEAEARALLERARVVVRRRAAGGKVRG